MKGVDWGNLYNKFKDTKFDLNKIDNEINNLF